ncbi:MAG: DUF4381 domain-containing protein [Parachlamydiaceae bacterium]|nr:DUF4381 domain-containing protein [Parachlamydiaceae bacterium]
MNNSIPELPLRDIHLPTSISWWPPAVGWWILLLVILFMLALAFFLIKSYLKPTLKKQARKQLSSIEQMFQSNGNATLCLSELSIFLRRIVLCQNHPEPIAGVTGTAWLTFLDQSLDTPEFSQGSGQILLKGPYQRFVEKDDVVQFIQLCHKWVDRL